MNKKYYKIIDGKTVFFKEPLIVDGMQIFNPSEQQILDAGWLRYIPQPPQTPQLSQEELLELAKYNKVQEIESYDNSESVNVCYINYMDNIISYWADKQERTALKEAIKDCLDSMIYTYRLDLREYGVSITIDCQEMLAMLQQLEVYAIRCYNKTTDHIYAVQALDSVEAIDNYDYTLDYPEKLTFNI